MSKEPKNRTECPGFVMRNDLYPPGQGLQAFVLIQTAFIGLLVEGECVERMGQQRISVRVSAVLEAKAVRHL